MQKVGAGRGKRWRWVSVKLVREKRGVNWLVVGVLDDGRGYLAWELGCKMGRVKGQKSS